METREVRDGGGDVIYRETQPPGLEGHQDGDRDTLVAVDPRQLDRLLGRTINGTNYTTPEDRLGTQAPATVTFQGMAPMPAIDWTIATRQTAWAEDALTAEMVRNMRAEVTAPTNAVGTTALNFDFLTEPQVTPRYFDPAGEVGGLIGNAAALAPLARTKYFCPSCEREVTSSFSFVIKEENDEQEDRYDFCSRCLAKALHQMVPKLRPIIEGPTN